MPHPPAATPNFKSTLESAHRGCTQSLGTLLESCRQYLLLIANQDLNPALTAKVGASDLVQETFLNAQRNFRGFRGATEPELLAWLRQILLNHLLTTQRRHIEAQKRSTHREISLNGYLHLAADTLPANISSPSNHFMRGELKQQVESAIARLPDRYRQVIDLRHRQALPFEEIARQLEITSQAARQLWTRAVKQLQKELHATEAL